ncbi:MAG: pyridoxal 5'-phosphate synthase glutaminase subunit PdxT [Chloroflexota bacterium]|jgi:5'-phosphate synthase pdxT subunit|nr:pyridoxal 5'-phosphate synthase glutaminase subunit PdxT [Chloroflexota bacterium]
MRIGVLALQGDFAEHVQMLRQLKVEAIEVRLPAHLDGLDGLIMPGGESTTFAKLALRFGLIQPLQQFAASGKAMWGTCAGLIFMAKDVGRDQPTLGVMDITVKRNAFGRQVDSFITPLVIAGLDKGTYDAVFIRAPLIETVGDNVIVLSTLLDGTIVAARENNMLATSFHPELTRDLRLHAFFLTMCQHRQ